METASQSEDLQSAAQQLDLSGYAILRHCLSDEDCRELGDTFANDCYGLRELLMIEIIHGLARSSRVRTMAKAVLGGDPFAIGGTYFNKTPAANWTVPWHQDRMIKVKRRVDVEGWGPWSTKGGVIHVQPPASIMSNILAVRLHLDNCPAENGALRVVPGSHRLGFLRPDQASRLAAAPSVTCPVPTGGAMLMRPLILHTSSPSKSASARRVIHLEFTSEDLPKPFEWHYRIA